MFNENPNSGAYIINREGGKMQVIHNPKAREFRHNPREPCPWCGSFKWWLAKVSEKVTCGLCHPPAFESFVEKWIKGEKNE